MNKPKRLLQFSLRGLVIFCAVASVWIGIWINRAREQREVVEWVEANGGEVWYENEHNPHEEFIASTKNTQLRTLMTWRYIPIPKSWTFKLRNDLEWDVSLVELSLSKVTDLTPINRLPNLEMLALGNRKDLDLSVLKENVNLKALFLHGSSVTDFNPIGNLTSVQILDLTESNVSDLNWITNLKNLRELILIGTQVNEIAPLKDLKKLQDLTLIGTLIDDVAPLRNMQSLKELYLQNTKVSKQQIEDLQKSLPNCIIYHDFE